jgi:hypothetical protein
MQFSQVSHRVTEQLSSVVVETSPSPEELDANVDADVDVDVDVDVVVVELDELDDASISLEASPPLDDSLVPLLVLASELSVSEKHPSTHATTSASPPPCHRTTRAT